MTTEPKEGQRVRLTGVMPGEANFDPLPVGATGVVAREAQVGQIWVEWDPPHAHRRLMLLTSDPFEVVPSRDIWWDDDGCWTKIGPQTYGPFATEAEAESHGPSDGDS